MPSSGFVSLVGAGPGDPGLFTLRGVEALRDAEVVIYDGLVNRALLRFAPPTAEIVYGGKRHGTRCVSQEDLNGLLLANARAGKRVVRLKGGDPYLFGRGGEEAEALAAAGIPFEVVPGVSSIQSVPACAGIPLTHRAFNSSVTLITGHEDPLSPTHKVDWARYATTPGTLVVLMGLKQIGRIAAALVTYGRAPDTPVAIVSRGTTARQRTVTGTLATIGPLAAEADLPPPAVTVIGEVVNLREHLNWFERRPLFGRRVVVTQRPDLARPMVDSLRERGADVLETPATRLGPPPDTARFEAALARFESFDWILFSHPYAVDAFFTRFLQLHADVRTLAGLRFGAYGPATAAKLREWKVTAAAVAADHKTPLILEAIARCGEVRGQRFLILRSETATEKVPEALTERGATVEAMPGFAATPETADPNGDAAQFLEQGADWVVFASALAIEHLHARFDLPGLVARFPTTRFALTTPDIRWALDHLSLEPSVIAKPNDVQGLVNAIVAAR